MTSFCHLKALEEREVEVLITWSVDLGIRASKRRQIGLSDARDHWGIFEGSGIVIVGNCSFVFGHARNRVSKCIDTRSCVDLASDRLWLPTVKTENCVDAPTTQDHLPSTVHVVQEILVATDGNGIGSAGHKLVLDVERSKPGIVRNRDDARGTVSADTTIAERVTSVAPDRGKGVTE